MRIALAFCLFALGFATPAAALERATLGWGRLFSNDALGDMKDRWRTGSYAISLVRGVEWTGVYPDRFGEMIEYRFRSDMLAPASLTNPAAGDRRFAGTLSVGMHTHFSRGPVEASVGVDLVVTGPMTGISSFQKKAHEIFGLDEPNVFDDQIGNGLHPSFTGEVGHTFRFGPRFSLRPFAEVLAGVESLARVGGDVLIGKIGQSDILLRDLATGQRYRAGRGADTGFSLALGGDVAKVWDSIYLPADDGYELTDARYRLRAGVNWQGEKSTLFYGLTWLGEEFEAQPDGQLLGSVRLQMRF